MRVLCTHIIMKVVNITYVMIKLQFKLPQALISRGFTRRTVFHAPALQQKGINRLMDIYQIWKPKLAKAVKDWSPVGFLGIYKFSWPSINPFTPELKNWFLTLCHWMCFGELKILILFAWNFHLFLKDPVLYENHN